MQDIDAFCFASPAVTPRVHVPLAWKPKGAINFPRQVSSVTYGQGATPTPGPALAPPWQARMNAFRPHRRKFVLRTRRLRIAFLRARRWQYAKQRQGTQIKNEKQGHFASFSGNASRINAICDHRFILRYPYLYLGFFLQRRKIALSHSLGERIKVLLIHS